MNRPTSQEAMVERLAILDEQIACVQTRIVGLQQRNGHGPLEDLEQALAMLIGTRSTLRALLDAVERLDAGTRPKE
ncbi:MAG TPA: hypothetical protein VMU47_09505 [Caldimonas sp.]|nr:hypothetical protein [Caldimonas sp.]